MGPCASGMDKTIHGKDQRILCGLLRQFRESAGLRQVDVAARLAEPQSFVSKYESGERRLDLIELREVCRAIEVELIVLVERFQNELP